MPLMKEFCFYCSARLGSITVAAVSIFQAIIPLCILFASGADNLRENAIYIQTHPNEYNKQTYFDMLLTYLKKDAETFLLAFAIIICIYSVTCVLVIIGAYKLMKFLLLPYIILELQRIAIILSTPVIGLEILKDKIGMGPVIGITIVYGFASLFLLYMWACVISLYQIISVINTDSYKSLYGDETASIQKNASNVDNESGIENINIFPIPNFSNFSPIKRRDEKLTNRLVTTISMTSPTDMLEKEFNNLRNQAASRNRLVGMVFYNPPYKN